LNTTWSVICIIREPFPATSLAREPIWLSSKAGLRGELAACILQHALHHPAHARHPELERAAVGIRPRSEKTILAKLDDFGARPFRSVTFGEFDTLAELQLFEAGALKRREMEEKVSARCGHDESEAPVGQALYSSFSHLIYLS
jgi:hypothetical protein